MPHNLKITVFLNTSNTIKPLNVGNSSMISIFIHPEWNHSY